MQALPPAPTSNYPTSLSNAQSVPPSSGGSQQGGGNIQASIAAAKAIAARSVLICFDYCL